MDDFGGQRCTNDREQVRKYVSTISQLKGKVDIDKAHGRLCNCKTAKCNKLSLDDFKNNTIFNSVVTDSVTDINHQPKSITLERYSERNGRTVYYTKVTHSKAKRQQPDATEEKRQQPPDVTTVNNLSTPSLAAVPVKSDQKLMCLPSMICLAFLMLI